MEYTPAISSGANAVYKPLDPLRKQIRILLLHPAIGNAKLYGSLIISSLEAEERPEYETISYCWGDARTRGLLILDGHALQTPASTIEALRGLRQETAPRRLWVDAVCINQEDVRERGLQVMLMSTIFETAVQTNIWLGTHDEHTQMAMESMETLLPMAPGEIAPLGGSLTKSALRASEDELDEHTIQLRASSLPDLSVLRHIFAKPWFTRLWVYQEAVVSVASVCHIGPYSFEWHKLEIIAAFILELTYRPEVEAQTRSWMPYTVLPQRTARHRRYLKSQSFGLLLLLTMTRHLHCTDPRDKIYGILALTKWSRRGEALPRSIQPDYSIPTMQCYRQATECIIDEFHNLEYLSMLGFYERPEERKDWPSWVCDFSLFSDSHFFPSFPSYSYRAHNANTVAECRYENGNTLLVTGYKEQEITHALPIFVRDYSDVVFQQMREITRDLCADIHDPTVRDSIRKEFFLVAMAGQYNSQHLLEGTAEFNLCFSIFGHLIDSNTTLEMIRDQPVDEDRTHHALLTEKVKKHLRFICCGRRFFCLQNPRTIGVGPAASLEGDIVAIFYGCSFPLVLRPRGETYQIVGPCYVYGMMGGEAVRRRQEINEPPEMISIH